MSSTTDSGSAARLVLAADTAKDMMETNPISIHQQATLAEAIEFLTTRGFSAAPVIDDAGRPVGVLSQTNLVIHLRESAGPSTQVLVRDLMTPAVFSVTPETPARKVVEQMLALAVHRMFVVDRDGLLVGIISAVDVLRQLK